MTLFDYLLITWWAFGTVLTVATIGKPRRPLEPSTAAGVVVINALFIAGLLLSRGVFA